MGKQRFWLSYTGQRGTLNQATPSPGNAVHVRGWNAGVKVNPRPRDRDEFDVYLTTGSHETAHDVLLGTVKDTPDGPVWEPAGKSPASALRQAATALTRLREWADDYLSLLETSAVRNPGEEKAVRAMLHRLGGLTPIDQNKEG